MLRDTDLRGRGMFFTSLPNSTIERHLAFRYNQPMKTVLVVLLAAVSLAAQPPDPRKEGPYPVGVTTTVVVDSDRTDRMTQKPRTLLTEIWYPASDKARTMSPNKYHDFFPGGFTPEVAVLLQA